MADGTAQEPIGDQLALQTLLMDPRMAIQEDFIVCLICGSRLRQLTNTHLGSHGTAVADYRARFGYNRRRALMCGALRRFYAERAIEAGLAGRIRRRPIVDTPELRRLGGVRRISLEEQLTRREARIQMAARQAKAAPDTPSISSSERLAG